MPLLLSPLFLRIAGVIAVAIFLAACWYKVEHWCNTACVKVQNELTEERGHVSALEDSIALTQKRATDLALLWSGQVDKTENAAHESDSLRGQVFAALQARAAAIADRARFSADAIRLFNDSRSAASSEAAGSAAKPAEAAPPAASSAEEFVVQMYEWASICRARVDAWSAFYRGLQQSVPN